MQAMTEPTEKPKQSKTEENVDLMRKTIAQLQEHISVLEDKLSGVLRPQRPQVMSDTMINKIDPDHDAPPPPDDSPIVRELRSMDSGIRCAINHIQEITSRLEV